MFVCRLVCRCLSVYANTLSRLVLEASPLMIEQGGWTAWGVCGRPGGAR